MLFSLRLGLSRRNLLLERFRLHLHYVRRVRRRWVDERSDRIAEFGGFDAQGVGEIEDLCFNIVACLTLSTRLSTGFPGLGNISLNP